MKKFLIYAMEFLFPTTGLFLTGKWQTGIMMLVAVYIPTIACLLFGWIHLIILISAIISGLVVFIYRFIFLRRNLKSGTGKLNAFAIFALVIGILSSLVNTDIFGFEWPFQQAKYGSEAMANTIEKKEWLVYRYYHSPPRDLARGDIVVYQTPEMDLPSITRCVAISGDHILYVEDVLFINGVEVDEPYKNLDETEQKKDLFRHTVGTDVDAIVSDDMIFALADNRYNGIDSRAIGQIRLEEVVGDVRYIYFSSSLSRIGNL